MSMGNDDPPGQSVERTLERAQVIEPVVVRDRGGWRRAWRLTRIGLLLILALAVLAIAAVWIWRKKRGAVASRLGYTLIVIVFFLSLWQLVVWRLFGHAG